MIFSETKLKGNYIISLEPYVDERGWFSRTYCKDEFKVVGHIKEWVQINHSFTKQKGTIRGMHYQLPPFAEIKMVRCIAGTIYDVIVDLRKTSPTFLQWVGVELSATNKKMIYIPDGFAHGFQTLTDDVELIYHHSEFYKPNVEAGIRYDDKKVGIEWIMPATNLSERDNKHNYLETDFKGI